MTAAPAVILDFDGVIVDSESIHLRAFQHVFRTRGWTMSHEAYYERYLGYSDRAVFEAFARDCGASVQTADLEQLLEAKNRIFAELTAAGAPLLPGVERAVRRLARLFPLAIASGARHHEIIQALEGAGLRSCFRAIVAADDVVAGKPAPEPYLEAARRLGMAPASCVGVEDSPWGLESARLAGLRTIGVTHTYPAARLEAADVIVPSLDDVSEGLLRDLPWLRG